jgi:hypothetical protein
MWINKPNGTNEESWIDLIWIDNIKDNDLSYWWAECSVKWDGCIHFSTAGNIPFSEGLDSNSKKREETSACDDYIHICDIDNMIDKLVKLKEFAMKHFTNEEWHLTKKE